MGGAGHGVHFLDACFLCRRPLAGNRDIFMYRCGAASCSLLPLFFFPPLERRPNRPRVPPSLDRRAEGTRRSAATSAGARRWRRTRRRRGRRGPAPRRWRMGPCPPGKRKARRSAAARSGPGPSWPCNQKLLSNLSTAFSFLFCPPSFPFHVGVFLYLYETHHRRVATFMYTDGFVFFDDENPLGPSGCVWWLLFFFSFWCAGCLAW